MGQLLSRGYCTVQSTTVLYIHRNIPFGSWSDCLRHIGPSGLDTAERARFCLPALYNLSASHQTSAPHRSQVKVVAEHFSGIHLTL